uniref:Tripeptidyl peptidase I n=1 Tax=Lepisosteus oculatus TaxID=7918 RepID=W5MZY3_LEPOC
MLRVFRWLRFPILALLSSCPVWSVYLESDQDTSIPTGWAHAGRAAASDGLQLTFALRQQNVGRLRKVLEEVSDPDSPQYGKYLSLEELSSLVRPSEQTQKLVRSWLQSHGIKACRTVYTQDFLQCDMSVRVAETLLPGSEFHRYLKGHLSLVRSPALYQVHEELAEHLDFVGGLHRFPAATEALSRAWANQERREAGFHLGVTPAVLRKRYNLTRSDVGSGQNNSQAVAQFLEQYFHPADLAEFMMLFGREFQHLSKVDRVVGKQEGGKAGLEASLDIEYIMSTGANISTWVFTNPGRHESQEPFLQWMLLLSNLTSVPWVHTISYGDDEDSLATAYMERINVEFMKAGARGITLLFASASGATLCSHTHVASLKNKRCTCWPSVGAEVTSNTAVVFKSHEAIKEKTIFKQGEPFDSFLFSVVPRVEVNAVNSYLKATKALPPKTYYNTSGRAYPDVAALSDNYWVVSNRVPIPWVSGTSASTPVFGGILSLINDQRFLKGLPSLGFLNPRLYKLQGSALFDVTEGCHLGCLDEQVQGKGFCAAPSWDPVTGWGTPNYPALLAALRD